MEPKNPLIAIKIFNRKTKESHKYQFSFQAQHFEDFVATMNKNGIKVNSQSNSKEKEAEISSQSYHSSFDGSYNLTTSYSQPNFTLPNEGTPISMYGSQPQLLQFSSQMMDSGGQSQIEKSSWSQNTSTTETRKEVDTCPQSTLAVKKTSKGNTLNSQKITSTICGSWTEHELEINICERLKDKDFIDLVSQQQNAKCFLLENTNIIII
ncbi:hypothetical protein B5S33_g276 [[Candida] boidinii]|nr:hypothetical protein B5S30_g934 [[Candida] boidinii]OWB81657.1 hypothetical protein B5S33_g276 [[Candida] boidinii]